MKRKLVVGIEILVILLTVIFGVLWLMFPNDNYESMFAFSGFVLAVFEYLHRFVKKSIPNSKDIQLFERFSELLSNNDYIRFYKEHDFTASFERQYWLPLMEIVEVWDNAAHQFVDPQLEQARKSLYKTANDLGMAIAKNKYRINMVV